MGLVVGTARDPSRPQRERTARRAARTLLPWIAASTIDPAVGILRPGKSAGKVQRE
ncbi:hypothetical protein NB037_06325 [Rathayibacter sp. ZW T2_19]|uniref:Uncharacterized protein n=1 Tax=Rathayibacter rubneri TaxID=2950106 RepID=A0A9X2DYK4_9MICO|nr:hypothetical protein [Rathayibacter rubneri]MCM6762033.1 hypothetical protein [Rathayibacter rubneri]